MTPALCNVQHCLWSMLLLAAVPCQATDTPATQPASRPAELDPYLPLPSQLHQAISDGNTARVRLLLSVEPKLATDPLDSFGETALHIAATWGQTEIAKLLIARGADVAAETDLGRTPLETAKRLKRKDTEAALRAAGAREPCAETLKTCPDGHATLKDVPVAYGYPDGSPEYQKQVENLEIWPGGCCVGPTETVVVCTTCRFVYDTCFKRWERMSMDPSSFKRPFCDLVAKFPKPDGSGENTGVNYYQTLRRKRPAEESLNYDIDEEVSVVQKRIVAFLEARGFSVRTSDRLSDEKVKCMDIAAETSTRTAEVIVRGESFRMKTTVILHTSLKPSADAEPASRPAGAANVGGN